MALYKIVYTSPLSMFYVDNDCIACDTCSSVAGGHFKLTEDNSVAVVFQQPASEQETALCKQALECCPVGAIGHD